MRLTATAPELVASEDHAYVACVGDQLTLFDSESRRALATAALPAGAQLGFLGNRLLTVVPGASTRLALLALPTLEPVAEAELEGRLRLLALTGSRALVATDGLEQPRVIGLLGTKLLVEPIGMREPLLVATAAPEDRLLVASRTRETQLECWDALMRRALFRLNLPLMPRPAQVGFSARRRLLWIASADGKGELEVFRFSDGRQQARLEMGAPVVAAVGHPESPRLILATRRKEGEAPELTELDFARVERREVEVTGAVTSMCVVERGAPALVVMRAGAAEPTWIPLAPALPVEAGTAATTATTATAATRPVAPANGGSTAPTAAPMPTAPPVVRSAPPVRTVTTTTAAATAADWRARLGTRAAPPAPTSAAPPAPTSAAPPAPASAAPPAPAVAASPGLAPSAPAAPVAPPVPAPAAAAATSAPSSRDRQETAASEGDELHWRDQLCDWAAAVLAHPRNARPLPSLAETHLGLAVARLDLEPASERALALLYGARLLGHDAVAAVTLARALGDGQPPDDPAWCEALARGPLAERRLVRQRRDGRLALRAVAARFLDGAAPRVPLLDSLDGAPESHRTLRLPLDGESLESLGARLVRDHGHRVALITLDDAAPLPALADALLEARLHDAWPVIEDSGEPSEWLPALDGGPILIAVRNEPPELLAQFPEL